MPPRSAGPDPASLTPKLREALEVLQVHPQGCHYLTMAEFLGVTGAVANSRCQTLRHLGFAEWKRAGVYTITTTEGN